MERDCFISPVVPLTEKQISGRLFRLKSTESWLYQNETPFTEQISSNEPIILNEVTSLIDLDITNIF